MPSSFFSEVVAFLDGVHRVSAHLPPGRGAGMGLVEGKWVVPKASMRLSRVIADTYDRVLALTRACSPASFSCPASFRQRPGTRFKSLTTPHLETTQASAPSVLLPCTSTNPNESEIN
ncbi:unnamed protein product, partial [Scytosiphon promiscuus]